MTTKEKIMAVIETLPDDVSIDQAIDKLYFLHKVEIGLEQADRGELTDHDEFMREILEDDEEETED